MEKAEKLAMEINLKAGLILFDWPLLLKACLNKKDLVIKLLNIFSTQVPGWVENIKSSVLNGDVETTRKHCHTICGATAAIHAEACVDSIKNLNTIVKTNSEDRIEVEKALDEAVSVLLKTKDASDEILLVCSAS